MKIVITHKNSDFDAIASLVAASKLHSDFFPVLGNFHSNRVQEFIRIHKDAFGFYSIKDISWDKVTDVIMVDFHEISRGDGLENIPDLSRIKWYIYDHHPEQEMQVKAEYSEIRETGSTAGMLVKHLIKENIKINFLEATLLAMGIYADTGSLTFPSTKPDDAKAVAWLLENSADLNIVSEYTSLSLHDEQFQLMNELIAKAEIKTINGSKILFCSHYYEKYIPDLSIITYKLSEFFDVNVIFVAVKMQKFSYIIGRAYISDYSVLDYMSDFSPKGHKQAAFAKVKDFTPEEIISNIRNKVEFEIRNVVTAEKIMSSPVRTISRDMTLKDAQKLMMRYDHTGFVVVDGEKISGIISRRDIEKAFHHNTENSLVKEFMSSNVVTINPSTTFDEIENLMIKSNMGRFPVIKDGKMTGIVTRSDILKAIYNKEIKQKSKDYGFYTLGINIISKMEKYFTPEIIEFLKSIGKIADEINQKVYLVGGGVRDLILGKGKDVDIDIVVEGNGVKFASLVAERYSGHLVVHEKYGTAKVKFTDFTIDIATSRTEFYEYPAANPDVDFSSIKQDLYRRDFTINALAIHLNSESFGKILDFFNGYEDMENKKLKVLHNFSFIEDPNRIFRAVRFEQKLGFKVDVYTEEQALNTMKTGKFDYFINDRIKNEVKIIFTNSYNAPLNIKRLSEFDSLRFFNPEIKFQKIEKRLKRLFRYIEIYKKIWKKELREWVIYLSAVLNTIQMDDKFNNMVFQIRPDKEEQKIIMMTRDILFKTENIKWEELSDSDIYYFLKKYPDEVMVYCVAFSDNKNLIRSIYKYLAKLKDIKIKVDGAYLKNKGIKQGKDIGYILETIMLAKLNGKIITEEQEYEFTDKIIKENTFHE